MVTAPWPALHTCQQAAWQLYTLLGGLWNQCLTTDPKSFAKPSICHCTKKHEKQWEKEKPLQCVLVRVILGLLLGTEGSRMWWSGHLWYSPYNLITKSNGHKSPPLLWHLRTHHRTYFIESVKPWAAESSRTHFMFVGAHTGVVLFHSSCSELSHLTLFNSYTRCRLPKVLNSY